MGNSLNPAEIDAKIASILDNALGESPMSLRQLSERSGVKLTRLGDVLRRGRAITTGELEAIARALGLVPWKVMREAEQAVAANVSNLAPVPDLPNTPEPEPTPDFSQMAARVVTHRPEWEAAHAYDNVGEESQLPPDEWDE